MNGPEPAMNDHFDSVQLSIQLTVKAENDEVLPFLNTLYRKLTHTNHYMDFQSHHPSHGKSGLVSCPYDRVRSITNPQDNLKKDGHHLSEVLWLSGYPVPFIRSAAEPPPRH